MLGVTQLMRGWKSELKGKEYWAAYEAEYQKRLKRLLTYKWVLGFNDRGHGHGDVVVIVRFNYRQEIIVQTELPEVAEQLVKTHNASLAEQIEEPPLVVRCIDLSWERNLVNRNLDPGETPYIDNAPDNILQLGQTYEVTLINDEGEFHIPVGSSSLAIPPEMFEIVSEGIGLENIPQYRPCGQSTA